MIEDVIDYGEYSRMMMDGYVREVRHPAYPFVIACYTKKAMFERAWNNTTRTCRGLIWNLETGEVLARPFQKFFNYGENVAIDLLAKAYAAQGKSVEVTDKMDGSLGIVYNTPEGPAVATKGSFSSDQALRATQVLRDRYRGWEPPSNGTVLVEIVYPENRIVLDYGDVDDLFLLGVVDIQDGLSCARLGLDCFPGLPFPQTDFLNFKNFEEAIASPPRPNKEGVVIRFVEDDLRIKVKQQDYVELHKICTGLNEKQLWTWLSEGKSIDEVLTDIPEELHAWAFPLLQDFCTKFTDFDLAIAESWTVAQLDGWTSDRKVFASKIKDVPRWMHAAMFAQLDKNYERYNQILWKQVRP